MFLFAAALLAIHLDQVGYPPQAPKVAVVVGEASEFTVHRDDKIVLQGRLTRAQHDRLTGDNVRHADFSKITKPGRYELRVGDTKASFEVAAAPYKELLRGAIRAFEGQRCGTAVKLGNGYQYDACHTNSATPPVHKGWHDAGDYGRYVVNSGITTGTLLWAAELFPEQFDLPRFLDEIRWNLEWMLSMQDDDGGVWHKQTPEEFPPFVMPDEDDSVNFVIGKGSCATANLAAVAAIASRVYGPYDVEFAQKNLGAATRAWIWLRRHPNVTFENPPDVKTGEYGDADCSDERLWAAAELWRSAEDADAHAYLLKNVRVDVASPPSWQDVGPMALWSYALTERGDARVKARIREASLIAANRIVRRAAANPYRVPMIESDYVWGSNGVAANYGLQLLVANELEPSHLYVEAALDIIHYLLGRNTFSVSWVTGFGTRPFQHPHHRPSGSDDVAAPWPGFLSGGPNRNRQDPVLVALPANTPPARMYADDQESYASNEVAINWNAPLVFLLAGVAAK